jgi:hypothetical protein
MRDQGADALPLERRQTETDLAGLEGAFVIFTAWGCDGHAHTLTRGEGPPCFGDGSLQPYCETLFFRIEADCWEDACKIYHELQG